MPTRRSFVTGLAGALAAPVVLRAPDALATSGELRILARADQFGDGDVLAAFTARTGIRVNLTAVATGEEAENRLRAAGGAGHDLVFTTADSGPDFRRDDLLREIDEHHFQPDRVVPEIWRRSIVHGASRRGRRHLLPWAWGTEGLVWDGSRLLRSADDLSWGDLWASGLDRRVALRPRSALPAVALHLASSGRLRRDALSLLWSDATEARRILDVCLAFALERRGNVGQWWHAPAEARAAFTDHGCLLGLARDTTGAALARHDARRWRFGLPREGGIARIEAVGITTHAVGLDRVDAFLDHLFTPAVAARLAEATGINACVAGAEALLSPAARARRDETLPPGAFERLWWWPAETPLFVRLRAEWLERLAAG